MPEVLKFILIGVGIILSIIVALGGICAWVVWDCNRYERKRNEDLTSEEPSRPR